MNIRLAKENMIKQQVRTLGLPYGDLLSVIIDIPREVFVPNNFRDVAYSEVEIPLNHGQSELMLQTITKILQRLQPKKHEKTLEIGCGSGYFTALLARLTKFVDVIDQHEDMLTHVYISLKKIGIYNAKFHVNVQGNTKKLTQLLQHNDTFDLIVIKNMQRFKPKDFLKYLSAKGRMLFFLEKENYARAILVQKMTDGTFLQMPAFDVYKSMNKKLQDKVFQF